jgi:hypothetical protein
VQGACGSVDESEDEIVHVGACRTGRDEIASRLQEWVAVVRFERRHGIVSEGDRTTDGTGIREGAGSGGRAVGSVGGETRDGDAVDPSQLQCGGEREFLVAAARPVAANGDGGLSTPQQSVAVSTIPRATSRASP